MTLKPKWTSESVGKYEQSLKPIEQPKVRTGNCLRVGVCASEGHKIPPQRQPLTDEQRKNILAMWSKENRNYTVADIIDAVEAAHGIKGEA